jgi:hypothetical protein
MNSVSAARLGAITGAVLGTAPLVEPMRGYAAVAADAKWANPSSAAVFKAYVFTGAFLLGCNRAQKI